MPYMNKAVIGDNVLDLTEDTVAPETLAKGTTAHDKSGAPIVGTMESGGTAGVKNLAYVTGYPGQATTSYGVTFTYQDDATILCSGSLTASYGYVVSTTGVRILEVGKTYTLSVESTGVAVDAYLYFDNGAVSHTAGASTIQVFSNASDGPTSKTFAILSGDYKANHITVMARTSYGTDYTGTVIKVMLEEGSEAHAYVNPWESYRYSGLSNIDTEVLTATENGTYFPESGKLFSAAVVNTPVSNNVQCYMGAATVTSTSYTATAVKLTVNRTGTYTVSWSGWRNTNSGTSGSQLYIDGTAYGSAYTSFSNTYGHRVQITGVQLTEGQEIVVRARARSTSYVMGVANLCIEQTS